MLELCLNCINNNPKRKRNGEDEGEREGEENKTRETKGEGDGGIPVKKQSDYVPGSLLDLRILCLWMKPVTSVDDETLGKFNLLTSLTEAISRVWDEYKKTQPTYSTLIIKHKAAGGQNLSIAFSVILKGICFQLLREWWKKGSTSDMDLGRRGFSPTLVWQRKEGIYRLTSSALLSTGSTDHKKRSGKQRYALPAQF